MRNGVKNPRGQKHVAVAIDYVKHCGGDDPQVIQNGHLQVLWNAEGRQLAISLPARANSGGEKLAKQMIRRAYRGIGVEVRA